MRHFNKILESFVREDFDPYFGCEPMSVRIINEDEYMKLTISFHHDFIYYNFETGMYVCNVIEDFELDSYIEHDLLDIQTKNGCKQNKKGIL